MVKFLDDAGLGYLWSKLKPKMGDKIATTAGDGAAFTATIDGITELTAGLRIIIIPHVSSSVTNPTLNLNNLGAKGLRRKLSNGTASTQVGTMTTWFFKGKPAELIYDGTYWIASEFTKPAATDLYGRVPVNSGGVPSCTADNNGMVLTVVDGVPTWAEPTATAEELQSAMEVSF